MKLTPHRHRTQRTSVITAGGVLLLALLLLLWGCGKKTKEPIYASDPSERIAYLEGLGWQVSSKEIEILHLALPEKLEGRWGDYAAMQEAQGLPFSQYAGQTVHRYTYAVTNYPGRQDDVQINLYLADDTVIGGDLMVLGEGGFHADLTFPQT